LVTRSINGDRLHSMPYNGAQTFFHQSSPP
jgi:hypothetical protein